MKEQLLFLGLALFCAANVGSATQQQFMFGIWGGPTEYRLSEFTHLLSDTLHFNTVLGMCYKPEHLQAYTGAGLKVICSNDSRWHDTVTYWPRIYTESAYTVFRSRDPITGFVLVYYGGLDTTVDGTQCRYFMSGDSSSDSLIQSGPTVPGRGYAQAGWYWPQHLPKSADAVRYYTATLRFKLGPRPPSAAGDTIAIFYIRRLGHPDEYYAGQEDPLIAQQPVPILNSVFGETETGFDTISLNYHYTCTVGNGKTHYAYDVDYQVRWFGTRDIYLDQVKVSDIYGRELWETEDGQTEPFGIQKLRAQAAAYFMDSPTILGWYQGDDYSMCEHRDAVFSARRVDSLLGAWYPGKKGFNVPGGQADYLALASVSNISSQFYPIGVNRHTSSVPNDPLSLQITWDGTTGGLASMKQLALTKGVPFYPLLQGFEGENGDSGNDGWRRPTAEENLCQVNLALAYGADGIWYWKYYGCDDSTLADCTDGLVYGGDLFADTTTTWSEIKNTIGPYIDKMGPIFASLEWKGATKYSPGPYPQFQLIDSIRCNEYSGSDLHLQVAYFVDSANTEYYLLVNRRCLPNETITGSVFLEERIAYKGNTSLDSPEADPLEPCPPPPCPDRWWVTNMETGNFWQCDRKPPNCECGRQFFNYTLGPGTAKLFRISESQPPAPCRHGDANRDGSIDISDAVFLITRIFGGGPAPVPQAAGDANCDGAVDISDAVFLISYIFAGGAAPCPGC